VLKCLILRTPSNATDKLRGPYDAMNLRNKSAGEWSVASAAMSTAGNAVKVFTTVGLRL